MKPAVLAIALTVIASAAFAQGRGGGGGGGGAATAGGSAAPAAAARQPAAAPGSGPVFTPGGVVLPGVVAPPTAITSQATVVAPGVTAAPGVVPPSSTTTVPTDTRLQQGVGQPLTTVQPTAPMTVGPQLGAGIDSQPGGFPTQAGAQTGAPALGQPVSGAGTGGAVTAIVPGGSGSPASPILLDAPETSGTASVGGANTAQISEDAIGVIIEGMMLSDVVAVDRERSCITLRSPDGTMASYRFTSANIDRMVAVGDQVVIETLRPLLASTGEAPSAFPRMTGRSGAPRADTAAASGTAANPRSSASTVISPLHQPGVVISTTGARCGRSGTQPG